MFSILNLLTSCLCQYCFYVSFFTLLMTCLVSQMIASKYLNDEGETESVLNSEWARISK